MNNVSPADDSHVLVITDPTGSNTVRISLDTPGHVIDDTLDPFALPIDDSWRIETTALSVDYRPRITVRGSSGNVQRIVDTSNECMIETPPVVLEIPGPVTLYLFIDSACRIDATERPTTIEFAATQTVILGALYARRNSAAQIEVTRDPFDLFRAISTFGTAIPTTQPIRSYPAIRGYPPRIQFSTQTHIPDHLKDPDSAVEIHVPATYSNAVIASPLVYYLGASLVPADTPAVVVDGEPVIQIGSQSEIGPAFASVLDRVLFLDSLCRQAWKTRSGRQIVDRISTEIDIEWDTLANVPYQDRLQAYFRIPPSLYPSSRLNWRSTVPVVPNDATIATTPHIAYRLLDPRISPMIQFRRQSSRMAVSSPRTRDRVPIGLDQSITTSFDNWLTHRTSTRELTVSIACLTDVMRKELSAVKTIYSNIDRAPVTVNQYRSLCRDELTHVIESGADFFHLMGHIDPPGLRCTDSHLPLSAVSSAPIELFFLNGCDSLASGISLIERGAVAGITTTTEVQNRQAAAIGETIAALVVAGFPIGTALELSSYRHTVAEQYYVVGDPSVSLSKLSGCVPYYFAIDRPSPDEYEVTVHPCETIHRRQGSVSAIPFDETTIWYCSSADRTKTLSRSSLLALLDANDVPVVLDGTLEWSDTARASIHASQP